ncbi:hypothetical protein V6N13_018878 [Hibiscus sabdariffa]
MFSGLLAYPSMVLQLQEMRKSRMHINLERKKQESCAFIILDEWTPYTRLPRSFLPHPLDMQVKLELACTPLISLETIVIHDPNMHINYNYLNVIAGKYGGAQNQEEEIAAPQDANTPMQQQDDQLEQGVEDANNPIQHHDA